MPRATYLLRGALLCVVLFAGYRVFFPASDPFPVYVILAEPREVEEMHAFIDALGLDPLAHHVHVLDEAEAEIVPDLTQAQRNLTASNDQLVMYLLQPLKAENKKRLRSFIEATYTGNDQVDVLRRIVAVFALGPSYAPDALCDDVIYASDNFGGIGLLIRTAKPMELARYQQALACLPS